MLHLFRTLCFSLLLLSILTLGKSYASPIAEANSAPTQSATVLGNPRTEQVPSSPTNSVYDVILQFRSTHPSDNPQWSPSTSKPGRLAGRTAMRGGERWIGAVAYNLRWTQQAIDWIVANNNGGGRFSELALHAFWQDSNGALNAGCISTFTQDTPGWVGTSIPDGDPFHKDGCAIPGVTNQNEIRITLTIPGNLVAGTKYDTWVWWRDDPERDLGKVPLTFVWSNNDRDHTNVGEQFPDDNVKKFCFGDDEGKSWGPNVFNTTCRDGAPVTLFSGTNHSETLNGFSGIDHWLPDNDIQNDNTRSVKANVGWEVRLYEHSNYVGTESIIVGDDPNLSNNQVGYGASSVKAVANGIAVFRDWNFTGTVEVFDASSNCDHNLSDNVIGDNSITAVLVPPGWRLELYDLPNEQGKELVIQGINQPNIHYNKRFNDITSSLCVFTPAQQAANGEFGDWTGTDD